MVRRSKATTLPKAGVVAAAGVKPGDAANFSDEHVDPTVFDRDVRLSDNWVRLGASLLRAARAIMRQVNVDYGRPTAAEPHRPPPNGSPVVHQAIFLAALAVENA
jgi:hypothetical protein